MFIWNACGIHMHDVWVHVCSYARRSQRNMWGFSVTILLPSNSVSGWTKTRHLMCAGRQTLAIFLSLPSLLRWQAYMAMPRFCMDAGMGPHACCKCFPLLSYLSSPMMLILITHSKWVLLDFTTEKFPFLPLLLITTPRKFFKSLVSHTSIHFFSSIPNCCVSALLGYAIVQTLCCCDSILYF